jgi:hypothetical protein
MSAAIRENTALVRPKLDTGEPERLTSTAIPANVTEIQSDLCGG